MAWSMIVAVVASATMASADTILVFGQNGIQNNFHATNNGLGGSAGGTTLSAVDISVTISGILNDAPLPPSFPNAYFDLHAVSNDAAITSGGHVQQDYTGTFSITSLTGGAGVNYLSGTFQEVDYTAGGATVFGAGASLVLSASDTGVPSFTSDVIGYTYGHRGISLSFVNVTPSAHLTGPVGDLTIAAFNSSVSGNFSAVPEPSSFALLGLGGIGMAFAAVRRRRLAKVVA